MPKILLVDDEPDIREMLKDRLEACDYIVDQAHDGVEGLKKVQDDKPDLIILDVVMPQMGGYEFYQELKRICGVNIIPTIVLTAKDKMEDLFQMEGLGEYMMKPFDADTLVAKIKELLDTVTK